MLPLSLASRLLFLTLCHASHMNVVLPNTNPNCPYHNTEKVKVPLRFKCEPVWFISGIKLNFTINTYMTFQHRHCLIVSVQQLLLAGMQIFCSFFFFLPFFFVKRLWRSCFFSLEWMNILYCMWVGMTLPAILEFCWISSLEHILARGLMERLT